MKSIYNKLNLNKIKGIIAVSVLKLILLELIDRDEFPKPNTKKEKIVLLPILRCTF